MRILPFLLAAMLASQSASSQPSEASTEPSEEEYILWAQSIWDSLDQRSGEIALNSADATLVVPESFYFLGAEDARTVLTDIWGNPADETVLGMLFPAEMTPFDGHAWGVTLQYEEDGYVSDADADNIDYQQLLSQMQEQARASNDWRVESGYEPIELVGWAAPPYYDKQTNKLHWAKELRFGDLPENTLNYNIRVLGRRGVLVLNFIAGIGQQEIIEANLDTVLAMAEFDQGARYSEFNPDVDTVAAYGIGALVAGKVMAKTGLLAAALLFLKKFGIYIVLGLGYLAQRFFRRKPKPVARDS